jgi:hypothetical protein
MVNSPKRNIHNRGLLYTLANILSCLFLNCNTSCIVKQRFWPLPPKIVPKKLFLSKIYYLHYTKNTKRIEVTKILSMH